MKNYVLARRYARAYCGLFPHACNKDLIERLDSLCGFLAQHKKVLFFLGLPQLAVSVKRSALDAIMQKLSLPQELVSLFLLVIAHKRAALLPQVCMQLRELVLVQNGMLECTIAAAQELSAAEKDELITFFSREIGCKIRAQYAIDKTLIAGVALRSTTYAWEYSIHKQLQTINQQLIT